jgi:hypothetical protein
MSPPPPLASPPIIKNYGLELLYGDPKELIDAIRQDEPVPPPIPDAIRVVSEKQQVYIFSVCPIPFIQAMGSYGSFSIPALPENECFSGQVAGPVVIPGLPSECILAYGPDGAKHFNRIYHLPIGTKRPPGIDFALEVIGEGRFASRSAGLRRFGVFISTERNPRPEIIKRAEDRLRKTAERILVDMDWQVEAAAKCGHGWAPDGNDRVYLFARILGKTVSDYYWLGE